MKKYSVKVNNLQETFNLAHRLGSHLFQGAVITLEGDLGAGKTTFTQGIAHGLHIDKTVNSPTFTIIKEYVGDLKLYHMDVYRLDHGLEDLGFDEYFYSDGVTVVEWASKIKDQIPNERLHINIFVDSLNQRLFEFIPFGKEYETLCEVFLIESTNI